MAKQGKEEKIPTKTHRVLQALRHNGRHYKVGATVDLTAAEAKTLIDLNVVKAAE